MHILLIHQAFAALHEPGGTRHHELALFLASKGHRVTVIASPVSYLTGAALPSGSAESPAAGVKILRASTYQALHKSFFHRLLAFFSFMFSAFWLGMQVRDVDVVWGTSPPIFQGLTAWGLARLKGAKLLFEVRDLWPDFAIAVGVLKNPLLIRLSLWLESFLYRHADQVMVNSPAYAPHVLARGAKRARLLPNGADPAMFNPLDSGHTFRSQHKLKNKFVVLYAGAHGISNDLEIALQAAALLQDFPSLQLVFLGDGKEKPHLQAQAQALGLKNVLFLPPTPKTEMAQALAAADACLAILKPLPEYKTTYPNKVFDYMAAGRPVALAIDGVIREVVQAAGCGIFVPPGDPAALAQALRSLAENRSQAMEMGLAGRRYLEEHFDRQKLAQELESLFVELCQAQAR